MPDYAKPIDEREGLEEYSQFTGLRNNVQPEQFGRGDLVAALNVDVDDALRVSRRKGYGAPVTAAIDRCLWAEGATCLGVGSNALKLVNSNWSTTALRTGLAPLRPLSYASVGARVYYSNGVENGCVENGASRTWGITPPAGPNVAAGAGALSAGLYQVAVVFIRSDGQESGAARASAIELTTTGGIVLSGIPISADPGVTHKVIYCSAVGGETLFATGIIDNADTTFVVNEIRQGASPLSTQFLLPPPVGDHIAYFKGWMLVAKGSRLYPSEAYAPELFDWRKSLPFTDRITMIAPLNNRTDGVWVGTASQVIWLGAASQTQWGSGASPESFTYKAAADYGVIPGTLWLADGELFGDGAEAGNTLAVFTTARGICVGKSDGTLLNLTQARYAYPSMESGAGIVRRHRGMGQYLVSLKGTEVGGNIAA